MKSTTSCLYPIIAALVAAAREMKPGSRWRAGSPEQMKFMSGPFAQGEVDVENIPEIQTRASSDVSILNQLLADNGFSIQMDPFNGPDEFGVVSIMKLFLEWLKEGRVTSIRHEGTMYPAVQLPKDCVSFFSSPKHPFPIVAIETKTGEQVLLSMADQSYDGLDLEAHIDRVFGELERCYDFSGLIFPMVDLDQKVNINWLIGMPAFFGEAFVGKIIQALQQTKFAMNEKGARVETAVAIGALRSCIQDIAPDHTINKPFFAMVRRKGLKLPIFAGRIDTDCWDRPASTGPLELEKVKV